MALGPGRSYLILGVCLRSCFVCAGVWPGRHALVLVPLGVRHLALGACSPREKGAHSDHPAVDPGGPALQPLEL